MGPAMTVPLGKAYLQSHQLAAGRSQENKLNGGTGRCEEELLA
jgi:hypothetical protein